LARNPKDNKFDLTEEKCKELLKEYLQELVQSIKAHEELKNDLKNRQNSMNPMNWGLYRDPVDLKDIGFLEKRVGEGEIKFKSDRIALCILKNLVNPDANIEVPSPEDAKYFIKAYESAKIELLLKHAQDTPQSIVTIKPGNLQITELLSASQEEFVDTFYKLTRRSSKEKSPENSVLGKADVTITDKDGKVIERLEIDIRRDYDYLITVSLKMLMGHCQKQGIGQSR
jgi:hypothetical protein